YILKIRLDKFSNDLIKQIFNLLQYIYNCDINNFHKVLNKFKFRINENHVENIIQLFHDTLSDKFGDDKYNINVRAAFDRLYYSCINFNINIVMLYVLLMFIIFIL